MAVEGSANGCNTADHAILLKESTMNLAHVMVAGLAFTLAACEQPGTTGPRDQNRDLQAERPDRGKHPTEEPGGMPSEDRTKTGTGTGTGMMPSTGTGSTPGVDMATCSIMTDPLATSPQPVDELVAVVVGTKENPNIRGTVRFTAQGDRVDVKSDVTGLPSGVHAHHVHVYGDCSAPETGSAGPHLDFERLTSTTGTTPSGGAGATGTGATAPPARAPGSTTGAPTGTAPGTGSSGTGTAGTTGTGASGPGASGGPGANGTGTGAGTLTVKAASRGDTTLITLTASGSAPAHWTANDPAATSCRCLVPRLTCP